MGRGSEDLQKLQNLLPFTLQKDQKEDTLLKIDINGHLKSAIDISAEILKKLKHDAELYLKHPVTQAVITVPAYFDEAQRAATKDAARLAGIDVLRLLSEPTAAALAYGLDQNKEGIYAIYDLGGGTFDISILKLDKGVFRVLATGGNAAMGGDDIDHLIAQDFLTKNNITLKSSDDLNELLQKAKALKEALTFENEAKLNFFGQEYVLSRTTFNQLIQPIVTESLVLFKKYA
jgi:molecular chaperone HscA